ncbi:MAG: phosphoribosylformylglycinamidine synthase subunit PurQ [Chthoniobacterales bacterium]
MKFAVIQFPGSNCDQDCLAALNGLGRVRAEYVWHQEECLSQYDAVVLPGGFSYGDYLRCGAIARFSPIMRSVVKEAASGKPVIGICNGFQILCEAGLLPGALVRNRSQRFVCDMTTVRVETSDTPFTTLCAVGTLLRIPVAHGEGCFFADEKTLGKLNRTQQVVLRYTDTNGQSVPAANPNGSVENIAGICNRDRNVFGLMPHPDRACEARLGSGDGAVIFHSIIAAIEACGVRAA